MKTSWLQRMYVCCVMLPGLVATTHAQPWNYDFGNGSGTHASGASTSFLPAFPSGTGRVRIGSQGGSVELRNPGNPRLGSATEAVLTAPSGSSLNKLQCFDFKGARRFTFQTKLSIGGGPGDVFFFVGNGSCFSDNVGFSSGQIFAGIRWVRDSIGLTLSVRGGGGWTPVAPYSMLADSVHLLELYANNSSNIEGYVHGTSQTVAPFCWDLWIDGNLIVNDQAGAGLPDSLDIDSFMFYAAASPSTACTLSIDDLVYTNAIPNQPLPVELGCFEARLRDRSVLLRWETETELQNFGFEIQRCAVASPGAAQAAPWAVLAFVPGDGDRHTPRWYEWTDSLGNQSGTLWYRLRQIDRDGSSTLSPVRQVIAAPECDGLRIGAPWPHPARHFIVVPLSTDRERVVTIEIRSLTGTQVAVLSAVRLLPAGGQDLRLSCGHWPRGPHVLTVRDGARFTVRLLLLI